MTSIHLLLALSLIPLFTKLLSLIVCMFASLLLLEFISTRPLLLYQLSTVHQNVCEIEACNIPSDFVYRIEKYIYGLPDSGRAYYQAYLLTLVISKY